MAMFAETRGKPSWGDDTDDEFDMGGDDEGFDFGGGEVTKLQFNENIGKPSGEIPTIEPEDNGFISYSEESESEGSESESEEEQGDRSATPPSEQIEDSKKKAPVPKQLTKAERKALKAKELDDLDALLADFGVQNTDAVQDNGQPTNEQKQSNTAGDEQSGADGQQDPSKKKKKKKSKKVKQDSIEQNMNGGTPVPAPAPAPEEPIVVKPAAEALKSKVPKKKKSSVSKAVKSAASEAKVKGKKEKKKRDKSKYNQAPTR